MNSELYHHGVLGQKWGIRRYQPYPTGSRKGKYVGAPKFKYKSKIGRYIKVHAKSVSTISAINRGKRVLDGKDYIKKDGDIETLKTLSKSNPTKNPAVNVKIVNKNGSSAAGRVSNCLYCTVAMEMRARGYDVEARRRASGISTKVYGAIFENAKKETSFIPRTKGTSRKEWVKQNYNQLCRNLEKFPDNARGHLSFNWDKVNSGHTLFWEVKNGSVNFYDGQSGKINNMDIFSFSDQYYEYARLDNLKVTDAACYAVVSSKQKGRR